MKTLNLKQRNNILMMLLFGVLGLNASWKSFNSAGNQLNLASNTQNTVTCENAVYNNESKKVCDIKVTTDSEGSQLTHTSRVTFIDEGNKKIKVLADEKDNQMCTGCYLGGDVVEGGSQDFAAEVEKIAHFLAKKYEPDAIAAAKKQQEAAEKKAEEEKLQAALNDAEIAVEKCKGTLDTVQSYNATDDRGDRSYKLVFKLNDGSAHILRKLDREDKTECQINKDIDRIRAIVKTDEDGDEDDEKTEAAQIRAYEELIVPKLRKLLSSDDESNRELAHNIIEDLDDKLDLIDLSHHTKIMTDGADLNHRFKQNLTDYQSAVEHKNPFAQSIALNKIKENYNQYQNSLYDVHRRTNPSDPFYRIFSGLSSVNTKEFEHWGEELEPSMGLLRQGELEKATKTAQSDSQVRSSVVTLSTQQVANRLARAQGPSSSSANKLTRLPFDQSIVQKAMNRASLSNYQTTFKTDKY